MFNTPQKKVLGSTALLAISAAAMRGIAALLLVACSSAALAVEKEQYDVSNARHEAQIVTTYALSPYLRAYDLRVTVDRGRATLTGVVGDSVSKDLAYEIALGVAGIEGVENNIVVTPDFKAPERSAQRSFGERVDDATVTAMVKSKLLWNSHTGGMSTNVDTMRGKVTLRGFADTAVVKELAGKLAKNTNGVMAVDNLLTVKDQQGDVGTPRESASVAHIVSDTWISAKVKSTFIFSSNVVGSHIKVNTRDGVVTLSGRVDSGAERALAIELAKNIRGVRSVESKALLL